MRLWSKTPLQRNRCATHACFIISCLKNCGQHTAVHSWSCGNSGRTSNDQDFVLKWNFMAQAKTNMYKAVRAFLGSSLRCLAIPNVFLALSRVWMHCWTFLDLVVILSVPRYFFFAIGATLTFFLSAGSFHQRNLSEQHFCAAEAFGAAVEMFPRVLSQLLFHCSGNLMYPCSCLFHFSLVLFTPKRACRCVPVHLLSIRITTCRTLVTARALVLTNPGPVSTQAAKPNLHRSACHYRSRPWHGHDSRHALHPRIHI